jgi:hypothetical protein
MLEQTVNIRSFSVVFHRFCLVAIGCIVALVSACVPVGDQSVNTKLFKDKDDMQFKAALLSPGMSKEAVFDKLKIKPEKFARMSTQEVQMSIYGNSQVTGTPDQLEQFRQKLMRYEGYSLPYREIKNKGSIGFGVMTVNKSGYDLKLVLIFEKNRLMRVSVDGNQQVNEDENESFINVLLRKGVGLGF